MPKKQYLYVLEPQSRRVKHGNTSVWAAVYLCERCCTICEKSTAQVNYGSTRSCGCLEHDARLTSQRTHGMFYTAIYGRWAAMLARCNNPNVKAYKYYGERGIKVCDAWHKFEAFYADMGKPPFKGAQLDRIDVDGNYEPDNVRWVTAKENVNNQQRHKRSKQL